MNPEDRRVKVRQEELERLLDLKSLVDDKETPGSQAEEYQKLGWVLQGGNPPDGAAPEVDSLEDPENLRSSLWETGLSGGEVNLLEVYTGRQSGLMVLEVSKGPGETILDQFGAWRAECIAALGAARERHFYAWDSSPLFESVSNLATPEISCFGEGQVVTLPPSVDTESQETWRWISPPWEKPLQCLSQPLIRFLQQHLSRETQSRPEVSLSWQEVYCLVAPFETLLQAFSASYPSIWNYYQGILDAAVAVGLKSPEVLLSLLWHAPRGNARQQPEIRDFLQKLVVEGQEPTGSETPQENVPWQVYLENFLALARETGESGSGQPAFKPGPPCFHQRCQARPPQPEVAIRTPFSCRKIREDLSKV